MIAVSVNKAGLAVPFFRAATEANPKIEQFWISYLDALVKDNQFDLAKQVLGNAKVKVLLGKKIDTLEVALNTKYEASQNHNRTEVFHHNKSRNNPSQYELDSLLNYYQNGQFLDAEKLALSMTKQFPQHQFPWKILGATLKKLGKIGEALVPCKKSILLAPKDPEAHYNLGNTFKELGRLEKAEASYKNAIIFKPDYFDSYISLFDILEKSNKLDEILWIIKKVKGNALEKNSNFLFYEALVRFRQEDYEFADNLITEINFNELTENRKPDFLNLKANLNHYKKEFKVAFKTFKAMNDLVKNSFEYKNQRGTDYFNEKRNIVYQLKKLQEKSLYKPIVQINQFKPTFLIGFPRSGTTLLDTILRTHSKIRRMIALFVGFLGTMIVLRPDLSFNLGGFLILTSALIWSISLIFIKKLTETDSAVTISLYAGVGMIPPTFVVAFPHLTMPNINQFLIIFFIAISGTLAQTLLNSAFKRDQLAILLPLDFLKLIWAVLIGYTVFTESTPITLWLGGLLIVGSSSYIAWRERK